MSEPIRKHRVINILKANAQYCLEKWLPEGEVKGPEYFATNPMRADNSPGSFKINLGDGVWSDFATGDSGGDLLTLHEYLGMGDIKVVRQFIQEHGLNAKRKKAQPKAKPKSSRKKPPTEPIAPEELAFMPPDCHPDYGPVVERWEWLNAAGDISFYTLRCEPEDGPKQVLPCRWIESEQRWHFSNPAGTRPLLNAPDLNPGTAVVFAEGEKTAEHLMRLYPDCVCTTSSGGSGRLFESDLSPLREVSSLLIHPDADAPGFKYAAQVGLYAALFDVQVSVIDVRAMDWCGGEDAADHPELTAVDYEPSAITLAQFLSTLDEVGTDAATAVGVALDPLLFDRHKGRLAELVGVGKPALGKAVNGARQNVVSEVAGGEEPEEPAEPPLTDEELSQVEILLNDPDILDRVVDIAHTHLDVVGEDTYVKAAFLAVVSCLQKPPTRPVSLLVKGEFGSGKSYVAKQVLKLFPEEAWYGFSGASSKALLYLDESFSHRMLFIPEASQLQSEGEHGFFGLMLRTLLTEGQISYPVTEAAEDGQGHVARVLRIDGPTGLILGTTSESINPENESRMVEIHTDESSEQTRAILQHRAQSLNAPAQRALAELESARRIWWGVYRGLAEQGTRNVLIPFLGEVLNTIEYAPTRFRRDLGEMLPSLIGASAILHQSAREERDGCVVATLSDYRVARDIISGALNAAVGLATTPLELMLLRFIYEALPEETRTTDSRKGHRLPAQKTIAKAIGVSQRSVGRHLASLEEAGYIENLETLPKKPARVRLGPEFQIRLIQDTPTGVLPSVEDIEEHGAPHLPEMEAQ